MTSHTIPVPTRLQRPACSCGWQPPLPWPVSWARFDADALAHLTQVTPGHAHALDDAAQRCPTCRAEATP